MDDSRSLKMAPFDISLTSSYSSSYGASIVTPNGALT